MISTSIPSSEVIRFRGHELRLDRGPLVMGVLNVTPDSFSDGGRYLDPKAAVDHGIEMVEQGADLIDVGAESSRPGSDPVSPDEEIRRLIPVVRELCRRTSIPISVDTTKAVVAKRALDAGAATINDISALRFDPDMGTVVSQEQAGLVLMHMQGTPKTMQHAPHYGDVVREVRQFLEERLRVAVAAGISQDHIIVDPGIGFGKTPAHNLQLLAHLHELLSLGLPVLVGVSRKAFIGETLERPVADRLLGTAAAVAVAILHGATMVRAHDVKEMRDVAKMAHAITRQPNFS
ncbi:MAG: dihydropteroate synthase [Nitrospiraceae bacterium]